MLARARTLFALASSRGEYALRASTSQFSSLTRDVAEANRELDEFFGVSTSSTTTTTNRASSARRHLDDSDAPNPLEQSLAASGDDSAPATPAGIDNHVNPGWDVAPGYGFAGTTEHGRCTVGAQPLPPSPSPPPPLPPQQQQQPLALTHVDSTGSAAMVDVSQKAVTVREAQASCVVSLGESAFALVAANSVAKGDVLKVAQLAGICGAKATSNLIPLCHNIPISKVDVQLCLDTPSRAVVVRALARTDGKTGVEMEALTAASVAALTVYDMCKAAAKDMVVGQLQLDYKSGGRSGTYLRAGLSRGDLLPSARSPL